MQTPILRPFKPLRGDPRSRIQAEGGLHAIKGNQAPYFSLTAIVMTAGRWSGGGAMHAEILEHWPNLADLAALHLSDIHGVPMHAVENAFYWLAGAAGGWGTDYHGGNSASTPRTAEQCLQVFADHVRVPIDQAREVLHRIDHAADHLGAYSKVWTGEGTKARKAALAAWCDLQRPRWAREAADCIAKHGLQVYS